MTLTSRLVGEYSQLHAKPFTSYEGLYRRLNQLVDAGLLNRRKMLWTGEFYYYLTKKGAGVIAGDSLPNVPARAMQPVAEALQRHEYEIARFSIKALWDAQALGWKVCQYWRDGEFIISPQKQKRRRFQMPDAGFLFDDGERKKLFLIEIDRSTQMAMGSRSSSKSFQAKLESYLHSRSQILKHPDLVEHGLPGFRLLIVCRSEQRLESLKFAAEQAGIKTFAGFTCLPRLLDVKGDGAKEWRYRAVNFFTEPIFSCPGRSPPEALSARRDT